MENKKRLIDANAIKYTLESTPGGWGGEPQYIVTKSEIDKMPIVDATEVVQCKDCKKWLKVEPSGTNCRICAVTTRSRLPYDFCSYGERRSV